MARRGRRGGGIKLKARKKVTVKLLEREHGGKVTTPYRLMERIVKAHHPHLKDAKIAIAWRFGKRADADGRLWLGQAKKGSDLDRSLHGYDFVILLNHEAWNVSSFTEEMMNALLDHELCHCAIANDSNGEPKVDEEGRKVYRIRKHDLEEFSEVVARHGQWKSDIRHFVDMALRDKRERDAQPLLPDEKSSKETASKSNGAAHGSNGHAGNWRQDPFSNLGLLPGINEAFAEMKVTTIGGLFELRAAINDSKAIWPRGVGPAKSEEICKRLEAYIEKHQEPAAT